ncbi:hypothetical protein BJ508DRAFT_333446 [Ascobolus immersus RN42]|uniref:Uncharacterized protein n=1 Tax=Ascobolus immersus RN42 TaxID=1160509 RepID=A0A3N4HPW3_ASCIM|nr:hypothetical protein BJ508DRAFT_333446 [Ascobolus immersus RN42]
MSTKRQSRTNSRNSSSRRSFSASRPSRPSSHQSYRNPTYEQPSIVIESSNEQSSESESSQQSEREESPPRRQTNGNARKKRNSGLREVKRQEENERCNTDFSHPSYSLEAHTFACPCGGTLKACWPSNCMLSALVTAKIPVFGTTNTAGDLASSISALPLGLHQKLMAYCLDGNLDVQAEVLKVLAEMKIDDWQRYDQNDPQIQANIQEEVERRLKNSTQKERPYIFALMGLSMSKGLGVCEMPSFTAILSKVFE